MPLEWLGPEHVLAATMHNIPTTIVVANRSPCVREATRPARSTSATHPSQPGLKPIAPRDLTASLWKGIDPQLAITGISQCPAQCSARCYAVRYPVEPPPDRHRARALRARRYGAVQTALSAASGACEVTQRAGEPAARERDRRAGDRRGRQS